MKMLMRGIVPGLALLWAMPVQAAEPQVDWARPLAGAWTLSGLSEGDPYCRLTLGSQMTIGGAAIDVSATCRRRFPLEEVAAWSLRGKNLVLIDALRKAVLTFEPAPDGSYGATLPGGMRVSLEKGAPTGPKSRKDLLDGTFALSGPNNAAACGFSIEARTANGGSLEQAGSCPSLWKNRGWKNWSFRYGRLELLATDGAVILSLEPGDAFTFTAERSGEALFFGPGVIETER